MTYELNSLSPLKRFWIEHNSNIPARFHGFGREDIIADMGEFPKTVDDWISRAVDGKVIRRSGGLGETGKGLLFDGPAGRGKTTHAVVTLMEFIRQLPDDEEAIRMILGSKVGELGRKTRAIHYLTFPDLFTRKKAIFDADSDERQKLHLEMEGFHGRAKDDSYNVRLLVLDDLGKEYGSAFNDAVFDEILRSRFDKALPTITTSNILLENWSRQYKEAMGSFAYEAFDRVTLSNKTDLRKG